MKYAFKYAGMIKLVSMFVSVTRLRLRSVRFLPVFLLRTFKTRSQATVANGFLGGEVLLDRKLVFWTITQWVNEAAMIDYRNSNAHRLAMPKLLYWCDEASASNWIAEGTALPDWMDAFERLKKDGKFTKVLFPSAGHATRDFPPPRLTIRGKMQPSESGGGPDH